MTPNKYWDEHGNCRACGHSIEKHAPTDLRDKRKGVTCVFDRKGKPLPEFMSWFRPLTIEMVGSGEFRKRCSDDSLVERTVLAKKNLEHRRKLAEIKTAHAAEVAGLHQKIRDDHADWEAFHQAEMAKQERHFRRQLDAKDAEIGELKDLLAEMGKSHQEELAESEARHETELEQLIAQLDEARGKLAEARREPARKPVPPPTPAKPVGKPIARVPVRRVTAEDLPKTARPVKLPGVNNDKPAPETTFQVVNGGRNQ